MRWVFPKQPEIQVVPKHSRVEQKGQKSYVTWGETSNMWTKFQIYLPNNSDISLKTINVNHMLALEEKSESLE